MKKYLLFGLLLLASLSFASKPTPPFDTYPLYWQSISGACCQSWAAFDLLYSASGNYGVWVKGGCAPVDLSVQEIAQMNARNNAIGAYRNMLVTCYYGGESTADCQAARSSFNSYANAWNAVSAASKMVYYGVAREAVIDNKLYGGDCSTSRMGVVHAVGGAMNDYRACVQSPMSCFE